MREGEPPRERDAHQRRVDEQARSEAEETSAEQEAGGDRSRQAECAEHPAPSDEARSVDKSQ